MRSSRGRILPLLACLAVLAADGGDASAAPPGDDVMAALNRALVEKVVIPGHVAFAESTAALEAALGRWCAGDEAVDIAEVRADFASLMHDWQYIQPLQFGPIMEDTGPARVQLWPDRRGAGERQRRRALREQDPALGDPAVLREKSVALRDLQTLEYLLHDDPAGPAPHGFACSWAEAVAAYQADFAAGLRDAWREEGGFRDQVLGADANAAVPPSDVYYEPSEPTGDFLKSMTGALDLAIASKLEPVLGESIEAARPKLAENWRSGLSAEDIAANLDLLHDLFATPDGFADLLDEAGSGALGQGIAGALADAVALLDGLAMPLSEAVTDPAERARLEELLDKLKGLRLIMTTSVSRDIGLAIGFNASDGD